MSFLCYLYFVGAHVVFVLFVFVGGSCRICVFCIYKGVHVAFVLFVFA
jgi:hypothetical protein